MKLSMDECRQMYGKGFSAGTLLIYVAITALGAGILKMLFSKRGKISFAGITMTWGN